MSTRSFKFAGIGVAVLMGAAVAWAQQGARGGEWARYGADAGITKYAPLDQIDKQNVSRLRIAWQRPAVDPSITARVPDLSYSGNFRATPVMIGGVLYSPNGVGLVEAFHPGTGKTLWVQEPFADQGPAGFRGTSARGITPWADGNDRRLFVVRGEYLIALDVATGKPVTAFGEGGRVDLKPGLGPRGTGYVWTGVPQVCRDVVIVGVGTGGSMSDRATQRQGVPGVVQAFDVRTGKPRWKFNPIPRPGEVGSETWEEDSWSYSGDANLWSLISADEEEGLAYLPMTSPTSDMYGGHRLGNNLFGNTLVCVRCATGERVWHYQIVHHDLWDYDLPAAPILANIRVDGKPIKAVVQLTKQAFAFVFDRLTGRPVWPIEERRVPASDVPGRTHIAHAAISDEASGFRSAGVDDGRSDRLHPGAARRGSRAAQVLPRRPAVHPAVGTSRGTGRASWDHSAARLGRRRRLAERRVRSGDRHPVRAVHHDPVHGRHREAFREIRSQLRVRHSCLDSRPAGPAALQTALRTHHRHRLEQRRAALDDPERRRSARPSASEAAQPAAARQPRAELSVGDQDARLSGRRRSR